MVLIAGGRRMGKQAPARAAARRAAVATGLLGILRSRGAASSSCWSLRVKHRPACSRARCTCRAVTGQRSRGSSAAAVERLALPPEVGEPPAAVEDLDLSLEHVDDDASCALETVEPDCARRTCRDPLRREASPRTATPCPSSSSPSGRSPSAPPGRCRTAGTRSSV